MALRDTATVRGSHVGFHKGVEAAKKKKNGCLISPIFVMVCWLSGSCGASDLVSTFTFYPRLWALVR